MDSEIQVKETDDRVESEGPSVVDLNQATAEELETLAGIGPALARRIVAHREERGGFRSLEELTDVPGIGRAAYEQVAERLTITPPEAPPPSTFEEAPLVEAPEAALGLPEPLAPQEMPSPEAEEAVPEEEHIALEEEVVSEEEHIPLEEEVVPEEEHIPLEEEVVSEEEHIPLEEEAPAAEETPAPPAVEPAAPPPAPAPPRWPSTLAWLGAALVGALLGMALALLVFRGINGALDVSGSHAVIDVQNQLDSLAAEMDFLQGEIDGLDQRLKTLEGLTARMEKAESAVDALRQETADLDGRANALEGELAGISEGLSEVQAQSERVTTFFSQLQALLQDVFGDEAAVEPTPESPVETPTPTQ
jgi:competence ComEA-like helix-hairpin-helix protein